MERRLCGRENCQRAALPGHYFCQTHIGHEERTNKRYEKYIYQLEAGFARYQEHFEHPDYKTLKAEIAITRMLLEKILNTYANNPNGLILATPQLTGMIGQINQLVTNCQKLELQNKEVVGKQQIIQFCDEVITAFTSRVSDSDIISEFVTDLEAALNRAIGFDDAPTPLDD